MTFNGKELFGMTLVILGIFHWILYFFLKNKA